MRIVRRERIRVQKFFTQPSKTQQHYKDQCDINKIMKRFSATQSADFLSTFNSAVSGRFEDVTGIPDYRVALDRIMRAEAVFEAFPSKVRAQFENDPARFLDFCQNEANRPQLAEWGLLKPEAVAKLTAVPDANSPGNS